MATWLLAGQAEAAAGQADRTDDREWTSYGRDPQGTHYSPLSQISTENVTQLGLEWSYGLQEGPWRLESTPVVSGGVLYATGSWSEVVALDATEGRLLWSWDPQVVRYGADSGGPNLCCGPSNRGVAVHEGIVVASVLDGRLVALNASDGTPRWIRQTTPTDGRYSITGAPRIINGLVIIGNGGAEFGARGYVSAYDLDSGSLRWRFFTVPGDPARTPESEAMALALNTWNGEWWLKGGGGTVWDGISYDPTVNLLYVGVGNGFPFEHEARSPGGGDNLFLGSILALSPETGALVWYYQSMPGEQWDYTSTQNLILADLEINGRVRKVLMQASKNGFFYVLDRLTGELISAEAFAHVTWATGIDLITGRPMETPEARYGPGGTWLSPGRRGAHSWPPMSWSPLTGLVYVPGENSVGFYAASPRAGDQPQPGGAAPRPIRPQLDASPGFLLAWDPVRQQERWRVGFDAGRMGGTLSTAGDLVFAADYYGKLAAYSAANGDVKWSYQLGAGPATPMTYAIGGRQFVAVLSNGQVWAFALTSSSM